MRIIFAAAQLLAAGWICSILAWRLLDGAALHFAFILQDATLALVFFQMSRGRWFPVALFVIHVVMMIYNLAVATFGVPDAVISLFLNRLFDLALVYVGGCALYRIRVRRLDAVAQKAQRKIEPPQ